MSDDVFIQDHIYALPILTHTIFLCEDMMGIGKLVKYDKVSKIEYMRSSIQYFLNTYISGDVKSIFLDIHNYELLGVLNKNYIISSDRQIIKRVS